MIVAELMTPNPVTVSPSDELELAYDKMKTGAFREVPVVDQGKLIGILTDRDLRQHLGQLHRTKVDAVMADLPFWVSPCTPVEQAAHLLVTNKISSVPVLENGKLVGIITASDMLRALEALLGSAADGSVRIDLGMSRTGEISAAISLVRTVCPLLCVGTYNRRIAGGPVLYMRVAASDADRVKHALQRYGFKILAVHQERMRGGIGVAAGSQN
jgi:acetoin utilization protein AcuB